MSYVCIVIETPVKLIDKAWKQDQSETCSGDGGVGQRHSSVEQVSILNCRHTKVIFIIRNLTITAVIITEESFIKVLRSQNFVSFYEKYLSH